jgi:hypothetical protein
MENKPIKKRACYQHHDVHRGIVYEAVYAVSGRDGSHGERDNLRAGFDFDYMREDCTVSWEVINSHLDSKIADDIREFEKKNDVKIENAAEIIENARRHLGSSFYCIIQDRDYVCYDEDEDEFEDEFEDAAAYWEYTP